MQYLQQKQSIQNIVDAMTWQCSGLDLRGHPVTYEGLYMN